MILVICYRVVNSIKLLRLTRLRKRIRVNENFESGGIMDRKKLIIFDMDGTLADTAADLLNAGNHMLTELGFEKKGLADLFDNLGKGGRHLVTGLLGHESRDMVDQGLEIMLDYYKDHLVVESRLYPGVEEGLKLLQDRNLAILSNKGHRFNYGVSRGLKIDGYFKMILGATGKLPRKPDPTSTQYLMNQFNALKFETLFVGDSLVDAETARRAGVDFVAVSYGYAKTEKLRTVRPMRIIDSMEELADFV